MPNHYGIYLYRHGDKMRYHTTDDLNMAYAIADALRLHCEQIGNGIRVTVWDEHENRRIA